MCFLSLFSHLILNPPSSLTSHLLLLKKKKKLFPPPQLSHPVPLWPPPLLFPPTAPPLLASSPSLQPTWCQRLLSRSPPSLQWSGPPLPLRPPAPAPTGSKVIYHDSSQSIRRCLEGGSPPEHASLVIFFFFLAILLPEFLLHFAHSTQRSARCFLSCVIFKFSFPNLD